MSWSPLNATLQSGWKRSIRLDGDRNAYDLVNLKDANFEVITIKVDRRQFLFQHGD